MSTAPKRILKWGLHSMQCSQKVCKFYCKPPLKYFASSIDIFSNDNTTAGSIPVILFLWSN
jgi:hypothetical protein